MSDYTNTGKKAYPPRGKMLTIPEGGKAGQVLVKTANGVEWKDVDSVLPKARIGGLFLMSSQSGVEWHEDRYPPTASESTGGVVKQAANVAADDGLEALISALITAGIMAPAPAEE